MINLAFNEEEAILLEPIRRYWESRSRKTFSLERLLNRWATLTERLEDGTYDGNIHDYKYELSVRDVLEDLLGKEDFPKSIRLKINAVLQDLDSQFNSITKADLDGRLVKTIRDAKQANWWWQRLPPNFDQINS